MAWRLTNVIPIYFLPTRLITGCLKVKTAAFRGSVWMMDQRIPGEDRLYTWRYKLRWINLWAGIIGVSSWRERLTAFSNLLVVFAAGQKQRMFLTTQQFIRF